MYRSVLVTVLDDGIDMMAKTQRMFDSDDRGKLSFGA